MSTTQDNVSYDRSLKLDGSIADKPYLQKEMLYVIDNNGSTNYSRNQVEFETISLSNNGKWCDYANGYISIPTVTVLTSGTAFVADDKENGILFKSDYCNIIDSVTVDFNNTNKIQQNANITPYLVFKKHTTFSENDVLTNSLSRMQRLVIVPILSASGNGDLKIPPQESPYASEPSTCSPHFIRDFNVQLSGSNIYKQNVNYKYEQFLNEMCGTFGTNANQVTGLTSSLISQKDYNENYGYIVVDLSRRYSYDNETPMSVQINGIIASPKALDFLCYISYMKDTTIDLLTGKELA